MNIELYIIAVTISVQAASVSAGNAHPSVKRSLAGQSGRLSDNTLINELSDIEINGQNGGQKRLAMALIGYARVSTAEQDTALQTDALRKAGCERVFEDVVSGAKADRPGLTAALAYLRDGDVLAVLRLDRLGRSLPHLIETIGALEARGVGFRSLTESIDTTTSGGRLIFHVFGALGQFERDLIRDRTKAGLTAAAARGRKGGRKPVVTAEKLQRAQEHIANGLNVREAATRLKVSKTALYAALQAAQATGT
jgi:DNA invertase Pin-like site-specific DNA recombinase